jgi:hypothetical protein
MNGLRVVRDVVLGSVIVTVPEFGSRRVGRTHQLLETETVEQPIAAWVSLWEALAMFLVNWAPHRRLIRMYERIAKADVRFQEVEHEAEA